MPVYHYGNMWSEKVMEIYMLYMRFPFWLKVAKGMRLERRIYDILVSSTEILEY